MKHNAVEYRFDEGLKTSALSDYINENESCFPLDIAYCSALGYYGSETRTRKRRNAKTRICSQRPRITLKAVEASRGRGSMLR